MRGHGGRFKEMRCGSGMMATDRQEGGQPRVALNKMGGGGARESGIAKATSQCGNLSSLEP